MKRTFSSLAAALLLCAGAAAATVNSTFTMTGSATVSNFTNYALTGQATLTNVGSGTFASTFDITKVSSTGTVSAPFTIALSGGTLTGTFTEPTSVLLGSPGNATATVTGGTGSFAGYTGSYSPLAVTSTGGGASFSVNGTGTLNTSGGATTPPTITDVLDGAGNTPNIAQGGIFIVKGSGLSASGYTPFAPPRPTVSGGIKVTFTPVAGGTGTDVYLVYLYNLNGVNQIAGILPSTVPVGYFNVTVTNGTVSAPFLAQVVASKFALFTQDSTGTGLASVQNYISQTEYDLNRLTTGTISGVTYSPAKPGQYMIAYGTGLGGYANGDNTASPAFDFSKTLTIQAIVGGISIPVAYAGRAGYAGEDQINFVLPSNIPTGCAVSFQVSVNGVLSPTTSISIAPDIGSNACVLPGYTTAQLQSLDQGGTLTAGGFSITQYTISGTSLGTYKSDSIDGSFGQVTGFQLAAAAQMNVSIIPQGGCQVIHETSGANSGSTGSVTYLDAGNVTITGPAGSGLSSTALTETGNTYDLSNYEGLGGTLPGQVSFTLPAGGYSLSGAGGADVGFFSTSITLPTPLTLSSPLPATVNRSSPLTFNWTGGNATDLVEIIGSSSTSTVTGTSKVTNTTAFICLTTAGQKTFTVPVSVLSQLPASAAGATGFLEVASGTNSTTFLPTLKSNGSAIPSTFGSFIGIADVPTYQ